MGNRTWGVELARAEAALRLAARRTRAGGPRVWKVTAPGSCTRGQLLDAADTLAGALAEELGPEAGFVLAVRSRATAERPSVDRSMAVGFEAAESQARSLRLAGFEVKVRAPNAHGTARGRALAVVVDGALRTLAEPTPFGRSDAAGVLNVNAPNVSWIHGMFVPTPAGWGVIDSGSTNGTTLNGRRVGSSPVTVKPGDVILLAPGSAGGCQMKVTIA